MSNQMIVEEIDDTDILVRRQFNASPNLVWRAHTEPELIKRWMLGPDGWEMPVCEIDLRVGGAYRYRWAQAGTENAFGFFGTFKEIEPGKRIVHTESPDWEPDTPPAIITTSFEASNSGTTLTMVMSYALPEIRQAVIETGMVGGMEQTFDRLERLLPEFA
jgi:uncharacterized protein YndB with AHSA1/START domain